MTQETLLKIHKEYLNSLIFGKDILSVTKNLYERLNKLTIREKEQHQFDLFLDGVQRCIKHRERTNDFTSLLESLSTTIIYIIIFMNNRKSKNWDINIRSRRKSLEKDLSKILLKAIKNSNTHIRDRFGSCLVLLNDNEFCTEELYHELNDISDSIQDILCSTNRKLRNEFCEFVSDIKNPLIKPQIDIILGLPFSTDFFKNFVKRPKNNGYQSIHLCLRIDYAADYFAGAEMELQIRSLGMDLKAALGEYNHDEYDNEKYKLVEGVFKIHDEQIFKFLNISGFTSYVSNLGDIDGIGSQKILVNRRVSQSLIPTYK